MEPPLSPVFINLCLVFTFFTLFVELNSQINANIAPPRPPPLPPATPPQLAPPPTSHGLALPPPPESQSPAETAPFANENKENTGKTIGLLFVGIAAIFQIGVVGFLAFKRRQLLKIIDRYETRSS